MANIAHSFTQSGDRGDPDSKLAIVDLDEEIWGVEVSMAGDTVDFSALLNRWPTKYERASLEAAEVGPWTMEVGTPEQWTEPLLIVLGAPRERLGDVVEGLKDLVDQAEDRLAKEAQLHAELKDQVYEELRQLLRPPSAE